MKKIVCISDTHGFYENIAVPDGDILIHAGDFGQRGQLSELSRFHDWMASFPHAHKIFVAGNHDWCFERHPEESQAIMREVTYLQDAEVTVMGLKIYGSPWQPRFFDWAFNLNRGKPLAAVWAKVPLKTDILVTHSPPSGILDLTAAGINAGCEDLIARVKKVKPKLHCFGHIHEGYGRQAKGDTTYVNASICDEDYSPRNLAVVVEVE